MNFDGVEYNVSNCTVKMKVTLLLVIHNQHIGIETFDGVDNI